MGIQLLTMLLMLFVFLSACLLQPTAAAAEGIPQPPQVAEGWGSWIKNTVSSWMGRNEPAHSTAAGNPNDTNGQPNPFPNMRFSVSKAVICDKCKGIHLLGKCIHDAPIKPISLLAHSRSEGICFHREDNNPTLCDICNGTGLVCIAESHTYGKNFRAKKTSFGDLAEEMDYGTGNLPGSLPDFELA